MTSHPCTRLTPAWFVIPHPTSHIHSSPHQYHHPRLPSIPARPGYHPVLHFCFPYYPFIWFISKQTDVVTVKATAVQKKGQRVQKRSDLTHNPEAHHLTAWMKIIRSKSQSWWDSDMQHIFGQSSVTQSDSEARVHTDTHLRVRTHNTQQVGWQHLKARANSKRGCLMGQTTWGTHTHSHTHTQDVEPHLPAVILAYQVHCGG